MQPVCVIIPTMRRTEGVTRALRSVFAQTDLSTRPVSIVVVDNDPAETARQAVESLRSGSPFPLAYRHEPRPGVATARNSALAETPAPLIAFLDDDEAASPGWLAALLQAQEQTGADAVFGPITGRVPEGTGWASAYLERFFGREGPASTGLINHGYGCGNSLMVRSTALPGPAPFDTGADQTGGEDDALFAALQTRGGRFGWAADAWVEEFAPPHRATMRYALARAFAYGQGPSQTAAKARDWAGVARWMVIGTAQAAVWGLAAIGLTAVAHPRRAEMMDRAARGLGKLFWMKGFEPRFYGARELRRLETISPSAA
ncbi:glycosyltransferase family 2 protein [Brevundimonas aurifodinae]|uniref:Glycosyltransferase family 2 protein n=2 Tax=Brevundimonas TaxID=41275 RepID=A0ABV1NNZ5_9CAUL|nr:MAG: family 2 glycosyl transferase [Brevundimonas sp. 12-68-7]OYX34413.1 MAG: family 2 glycosyl transferase [Brevundimonas subvibrioides]